MSDTVEPKVPGQVAGTTEAQVSAQTQSQSAVQQGTEPASQQGTDEGKPVTAKDLLALKEELSKQIQSQVDKSSSRVQKELAKIDEAVKVLRASGREITDADVKTMKQNAAAAAMIEPEQEPIAQQTADPLDVRQWPQEDPVTSEITALQLKYRQAITSAMPQAAKLIRDKGPLEFVKSYEAALKEITSTHPQATETKPATPPAARIPAQGSRTSPKMTPDQKLSQGLKENWTGRPK